MTGVAFLGEEIVVTLDGQSVVLRPTLRAGIAALGLADGFDRLFAKVSELDTTTCTNLVRIGAGMPDWLPGNVVELEGLRASLLAYVVVLANGGRRTEPKGEEDAKDDPVGHAGYFEALFRIGTGWLGWSAEATLDTPMPAILAAQSGRADMLRAVFGGATADKRQVPLDEKVRAIMGVIGTRKVEQ